MQKILENIFKVKEHIPVFIGDFGDDPYCNVKNENAVHFENTDFTFCVRGKRKLKNTATAVASAASATLTGALAGSAVPGLGNIAGAIVGFGIGLFVAYVDDSDLDGNGKSLRDDIKDIVYGLVSGENGEKE